MSSQVQALVIGAGISGLTTGYTLQKAGISTLVLECASRPGGVIQSVSREGFLLEWGPQSFAGNASLTALCRELHILDQRVLADAKAPRYVLINGNLQKVPMGSSLLFSPLMAGGTRAAILRDLVGKSRAPEPDESVADFTRRKFSSAVLDRLIGPFVSGVYGGDPDKLSLRAAFPLLHEAEVARGSVLRGMLSVMKQRKANRGNTPREKSTLQTFQQGNETLPRALANALGDRLTCNVEVCSIAGLEPSAEPNRPRFRVSTRSPRGGETVEAQRVVLAVPTDVAAALLAPLNPAFHSPLAAIEYAGIAVVSLGYRKQDVGNALNGFGFLVPRSSGLNVLGTVWNSSLFPSRAPEQYALLSSFVGGATNPSVLQRPVDELVALVHRELTSILNIRSQPLFSDVHIVLHAIPQYTLGHTARLFTLETLRHQFPGLHLVGNYLKGPAVGTCIEQALKVAAEIRISFSN
jgi:protoporphyrinogen/coproporphyrinogen III oxidase